MAPVAHKIVAEQSSQDSDFLRVNFWKGRSSRIYAKLYCNLISDVRSEKASKFMFVFHRNSCCLVNQGVYGLVKSLSVKWIYARSCPAGQRNSYVAISFLNL